ncbi:hypothetical protein HS1genome_0651 [Sulfodiicoccus acidiphilus]|uniref:Class I SAM-dependent methyltransferase n=1 Tax=Sulfodiicoccus acidiphilus TaxID=1670455 RepID=A0A348B260_9CREN|nr:class I SAM-dependent methyltransferase [Sulfodiicoccus acidiphilus]BBD72262.1 hypothetical protein HS1genome_0651 [Sulfodiicoccus acidiphilus]GGT90701.1 hypothetical protein GCM10007116_05690 [Sulfodiicoccus acidiphilus]
MVKLADLLGVNEVQLRKWREEAEMISERLDRQLGKRNLWQLSRDKRPFLYASVKAASPRVAVETGVGSGVSTTLILSALENGELHSIDIGAKYGEEGEEKVGFLVPEELKTKWRLHLGRSSDLLEPLLKELGEVEFFLHDGEHTYSNVMFELRTVWRYMKSGIVAVDNYRFTEAPLNFAKEVGAKLVELSPTDGGMAIIPKS